MNPSLVIAKAVAEVGYQEGDKNDNKFAAIAGHANHQPWCATFVYASFKAAGCEKAIPNSAYCPAIESWARANNAVIPITEAKRGDLVLFDFTRSGKAEHIGLCYKNYDPAAPNLIRTIDGNTSSGAGSQANGDGVYRKARAVSLVRMVIRPKWNIK